jgi:hypothetical protein
MNPYWTRICLVAGGKEMTMDRRLFVTGLFGAAGAAALATVIPHDEALAKILSDDAAPDSNILPNLDELKADTDESGAPLPEAPEEEKVAWHYGYPHHRRRRRRRVRRWRRYCRRHWWNGHWRRRCRRRPFWVWIFVG